ncbi:MAG TPA: polyphenol oxidase family protein [Bacteriovoracaceae bacterium]|nr:polyphenol oxidase family protein [Bacteriovoracaceae bacterium]
MTIAFSRELKRGRFETWTTKPEFAVHQVDQVHGTDLVSVETLPATADGLVVSWDDLTAPLAIKTADCLPVVILGDSGVVHLHAGWRGLTGKILKRPEVSLIRPHTAFIGPFIHQCCFEVSADFQQSFPDTALAKKEGKYYFDLAAEAKKQLLEQHPQLELEITDVCTCCSLGLHSYRRDKPNQRNWNLYIKG